MEIKFTKLRNSTEAKMAASLMDALVAEMQKLEHTCFAPVDIGNDEPTITNVEPPTSDGDTDIDGLPWDARIHASSKATLQTGKWRNKRGVSPQLVKQIESELKAANIADTIDTATAPPPPPVEPAYDGPEEITFPLIMNRFTAADIHTIDEMNKIAQDNGLTSITEVATSPEAAKKIWMDKRMVPTDE